MAELEQNVVYSLVDLKQGHDPQGNVAKIINNLWEHGQQDLQRDAKWMMANDLTTHSFLQTLYLPTGTFTGIGIGIPRQKVGTKPVREDIVMLQGRSDIDIRLLKKSPNPQAFMANRNNLYLKGMLKNFNAQYFLGRSGLPGYTVADEKAPRGILIRHNSLAMTDNVHNMGGAGASLGSIYLIKWGEEGVYFCFPRDGKDFITETPLPPHDALDDQGNPYTVISTEYTIQFGICIADPMAVQRVCNIKKTGTANIFDEDLVIKAIENLEDPTGAVLYMPKEIFTQARIALKDKPNVWYKENEGFGSGNVMHVQDVPCRKMGCLKPDETQVA